jgi:hypothetical protein
MRRRATLLVLLPRLPDSSERDNWADVDWLRSGTVLIDVGQDLRYHF